MFSQKKCQVAGCHTYALPGSNVCYHHSKDKEEILRQFSDCLTVRKNISDVSIVEAEFDSLDMSGLVMHASNFAFCYFRSCNFDNASISTSFFDYSVFDNCTFRNTTIRYSVFSGAFKYSNPEEAFFKQRVLR